MLSALHAGLSLTPQISLSNSFSQTAKESIALLLTPTLGIIQWVHWSQAELNEPPRRPRIEGGISLGTYRPMTQNDLVMHTLQRRARGKYFPSLC